MNEENIEPQETAQLSEEEIAEFELSVKVAREAAQIAAVPDISTYQPPPFETNWRIFIENQDRNVSLIFEGSGYANFAVLKTSLSSIAHSILKEIKAVLGSQNAAEYLDVSDAQRDETIYFNASQ